MLWITLEKLHLFPMCLRKRALSAFEHNSFRMQRIETRKHETARNLHREEH